MYACLVSNISINFFFLFLIFNIHICIHLSLIVSSCVCVCVCVIVYLLRYYDNCGHVLAFFRFPSIGSSLLFSFIEYSIEICLVHFIASYDCLNFVFELVVCWYD